MQPETLAARNVAAMRDELLYFIIPPEYFELEIIISSIEGDFERQPPETLEAVEKLITVIETKELLFMAKHESCRSGWRQKVMEAATEWRESLEEIFETLEHEVIAIEDLGLGEDELVKMARKAAFYEGFEIMSCLQDGLLPLDWEERLADLYQEFIKPALAAEKVEKELRSLLTSRI